MNLNATLFAQAIVFLILSWFTMRFVWPPLIKAIDERREKIKQGLEASEINQKNLVENSKIIEVELSNAKSKSAQIISESEKRSLAIAQEIKDKALKDADLIIKEARLQIEQEITNAKQQLREQVANLAIKGAEKILRKEINQSSHTSMLSELKAEL